MGHHVCPHPTRALEQQKEGGISLGLLLQPVTSRVLLSHTIIPVKPEPVYLVLGFCSLAHTLASEKVYQQFHLRLFPALLNAIVMSIARKMWSLFQKDQYNLLPSPWAFSSYLTREQMTAMKRKDLVICQYTLQLEQQYKAVKPQRFIQRTM